MICTYSGSNGRIDSTLNDGRKRCNFNLYGSFYRVRIHLCHKWRLLIHRISYFIHLIGRDSVNISIGSEETTKRPLATFFYLAFKVFQSTSVLKKQILAVSIYLVGRLFITTSFQFVAVFLLSAVDFYTTKNFSGRYLIGVRWWSVDGGDNVLNSMRFEVSNVQNRLLIG